MKPGGLPCTPIDLSLLTAVKRSKAYQSIRSQVSDPFPSDMWHEGEITYVTFALKSRGNDIAVEPICSQIIFVVASTSTTLLAARVVEQTQGDLIEVRDLMQQDIIS